LLCTTTPVLAADTTPPVIGAVTPTIATANSSVTYSASFVDEGSGGVNHCRLNADGSIVWTGGVYPPNTTSGYASVAMSFAAGTHYLQFQCVDNANNWGYGPQTTVVVNTASDATPPTTGIVEILENNPIAGKITTFVVSANDNVAPTQCRILLDGNDIGPMTFIGQTQTTSRYQKDYAFPASTQNVSHQAQARCYDAAGNSSVSQTITHFTVYGTAADDSFPAVGNIQQTSAVLNVATTLSASVSGNISVCSLKVGGLDQGYMTVANGLASKDYIFTTIGSKPAHVECISATGRMGIGKDVWINISSSPVAPTNIPYGTLIKLSCPSWATADHPCKTVYYFGVDDKRHPFPNSKIYFTWYSDFNAVTEVTEAQMATIPLGRSVRYRPGKRMVKFTSDPKVYAVAGNGTLRWVTTQDLASQFYTSDWNKQIDDIPDSFYVNYNFGAPITAVTQYNPVAETNMANSIDTDL